MELETLKEIGEVIKTLGDQGTTAFIWYLVVTTIPKILTPVVVVVGVFMTLTRTARAIAAACKAASKKGKAE